MNPNSKTNNMIGGPNYPDNDQYRTTSMAANEGDPTEKELSGKKKLKKIGPTISISPISNQPLCNYGEWAKNYDNQGINSNSSNKVQNKKSKTISDPIIESLKSQLSTRGAKGFIGLQRKFKIMDDDGSGHLIKEEFKKAMVEMGLLLTDSELNKLFDFFDKDKSGTISFDELIQTLRGELNDRRLALVHIAFSILDTDNSGCIDGEEMASKYDASKHPDVISGKKKPREVMEEFLKTFDVGGVIDGKVTREEFENYYKNISASIENEDYFELMMRNAWHISGGEGQAANSANLRVLVTRPDGSQFVEEVKNDLGTKTTSKNTFRGEFSSNSDKEVNNRNKIDSISGQIFGKTPKTKQDEQKIIKKIFDKLKSQLISRNSLGLIGLQRKFKIMDDDGSGNLSKEEFKKAMIETDVSFPDSELSMLFDFFDKDKSGTISFDEFIQTLRGELNDRRLALVHIAFSILDTDNSGCIDGEEMASKYDASKHPDVISGKKKPREVMIEFLKTFDVGGVIDGKVTREEFENYYKNISASIENEDYFELMMRNAWHISGGEGQAANSANLRVLVTRPDGSQFVEEVKTI